MLLLPPFKNMLWKNPFNFRLNTKIIVGLAQLVFPIIPATIFTLVAILYTDRPNQVKLYT